MRNGFAKHSLLLVYLLLARTAFAGEPVPIDIHAQPMADALSDFARQSDLQVLYSSADALNQTSPTVAGLLTPEDALSQLLRDS